MVVAGSVAVGWRVATRASSSVRRRRRRVASTESVPSTHRPQRGVAGSASSRHDDDVHRLGLDEVEEVLEPVAERVLGDDRVEALELVGLGHREGRRPAQQPHPQLFRRSVARPTRPRPRRRDGLPRAPSPSTRTARPSRVATADGERGPGLRPGRRHEQEPAARTGLVGAAHPPRAADTTSLASACTRARCSAPWKDSA